jgi:hypothetical protein
LILSWKLCKNLKIGVKILGISCYEGMWSVLETDNICPFDDIKSLKNGDGLPGQGVPGHGAGFECKGGGLVGFLLPDMNPCDFFWGGHLKELVNNHLPANLEEHRERIIRGFSNLPGPLFSWLPSG